MVARQDGCKVKPNYVFKICPARNSTFRRQDDEKIWNKFCFKMDKTDLKQNWIKVQKNQNNKQSNLSFQNIILATYFFNSPGQRI